MRPNNLCLQMLGVLVAPVAVFANAGLPGEESSAAVPNDAPMESLSTSEGNDYFLLDEAPEEGVAVGAWDEDQHFNWFTLDRSVLEFRVTESTVADYLADSQLPEFAELLKMEPSVTYVVGRLENDRNICAVEAVLISTSNDEGRRTHVLVPVDDTSEITNPSGRIACSVAEPPCLAIAVDPGIGGCVDATRCRVSKCYWADCWNSGGVQGGYGGEACTVVYIIEVAACLPSWLFS